MGGGGRGGGYTTANKPEIGAGAVYGLVHYIEWLPGSDPWAHKTASKAHTLKYTGPRHWKLIKINYFFSSTTVGIICI